MFQVFQKIDTSKNDSLDKSEFFLLIGNREEIFSKENLEFIFMEKDPKTTNFVEIKEVKNLFKNFNDSMHETDDECDCNKMTYIDKVI